MIVMLGDFVQRSQSIGAGGSYSSLRSLATAVFVMTGSANKKDAIVLEDAGLRRRRLQV
jgi:hypothetical protein